MKIAFDHQIFSMQAYGGISRYYVRLAEHLQAKGADVGVYAPLHRNEYLSHLSPEAVHGRKTADYHAVILPVVNVVNRAVGRRILEKRKPDIIHETYYARKPSMAGPCPVVLTVHDMIHEIMPSMFSKRDTTCQNKKLAVKRADHIICISQSTKKDLVKYLNVPEEKISVVHHGYEIVHDGSLSISKEEKSERPYLLFVGNRVGYKNFSKLLEAMASSTELSSRFDIIVFGGGLLSNDELKYIKDLGLKNSQVKQVSGDDRLLQKIYSNAAAFIYPSLYEGFGLPPLEAMAFHCPVVSSNTSSMPEILGDAAEYFNPDSATELKSAIERVVFSKARYYELVKLGIDRIKLYSWTNCAAQTLAVYENVIQKQRALS